MAATIIRLSSEQRVNVETNSTQNQQSVTALPDGGWLITWVSYEQDGSSGDIYHQRYDRDGKATWARERQVNVEMALAKEDPSVTVLADGGWVITWSSYGQDGSGHSVYQRYYDKNGVAKAEQRVTTETFADQYESSVTALSNGGWVVTWTSVEQDTSYEGVYQQCYDKNGNLVREEQKVNTHVSDSQYASSVTALPGGGWLVTWTSLGQDGSGSGIYQQRYNADGTPKEGEQRVNTETAGAQTQSSVTVLEDGGWLVTWTSFDQDGSGNGIYQQRYDKNGNPVGGEQPVNTETTGAQTQSSVTVLEDGGWIVTWQSEAQDGSGSGIYQQRYDVKGDPVGGEQQVNIHATDAQSMPSVTGLADGGWLVSWTSNNQDGSSTGVYQRWFVTAFGAGVEHGTGTNDDELFQVRHGGLGVGDSLEAGDGQDTLRMIEAGTLDLTAPALLTGIEAVEGSIGNDIIVTNGARLAGITSLHGGAGQDTLHLAAGSYNFSSTSVRGIEAITLLGTSTVTLSDKATALLVRSNTKDGALIMSGDSFTLAERTQLFHQGIRKVTDASGIHVLQEAQTSLSMQAVTENAKTGTVVGTLSAVDPNPRDGLRLELIDSAGGRFALSGNQLVVANGSLIDYEAGATHRIVVRVVDEGGIATDAAFTITLSDVPVEILKGTSKADVLKGGTGRDALYGGAGKDKLTGDAGQDVFVFDTKPNKKKNLDKIVDFKVADDTIWLDNKVFKKLGKKGSEEKPAKLAKKFFKVGDKAKDGDDYLIYDKKKGVLYYDQDGSGSKKAIEIAQLSKKLKMTYKDFFVI